MKDRRAFAGALALLFSGVQLTVLLTLYFVGSGQARAVFQSRWYWELALNFQIFLLFLMWVCHADRIAGARGWRRVRAIGRLITGLVGVAMPFVTLVVGAGHNWFYDKPPFGAIRGYAFTLFVIWVTLAYGLPVLAALLSRHRHFVDLSMDAGLRGRTVLGIAPFAVFGLAALVMHGVGLGDMYWVLLPPMFYLHGAAPYLYRAFAAPRESQTGMDTEGTLSRASEVGTASRRDR